ncbi:DUF6973 domain-containing protein [Dyadobacter psychrotolerans]|uniref:DUF6973 domain-containing protein n=1 Tax=Dyadobacter psychrotolerans TaxID=2541721 RepID=A0A4V2Z384_9BACT|nr:hypothetical protein [Dyadobacter psychrotolerans]TDE11748.1 hypothetical protein E0F88_25340 [Dyadobacter psychrotolerans]
MNFTLRKSHLLLLFALNFIACDTEIPEQSVRMEAEIFEFKGEKVVVPTNFPKGLFSQSAEDFDLYYAKMSGSKTGRISGDEKVIDGNELSNILEANLKNYPKVNYDQDISENDLNRIFKDFPGITTKEQALSKVELIFEYYNTLCKKDVVDDVIYFEQNDKGNGRVAGISPSSLTVPERNHLISNPAYAERYRAAANYADSLTLNAYYSEDDDRKGNAFKHSVWNALAIRYILKGVPTNENQAIDFVQDGTSKHEMDDNGNQIKNRKAAMDLHNNMSARQWMEINTKWGIGFLRKMPDEQEIINTMMSRANSSGRHEMVDILNWHGGDNDNTWNNLYNNMYSPNEHLVHIEP